MQGIKYADAGMDMKKLALCFWRRIWLVFAAAAAGAVLGALICAVAGIVPESEREYQAMAKIYLDFEVDETGEVYQHYNGYTWNDLMATDPILDITMAGLPEDYTRDEVMAATRAEILSDVRLLTITITAHTPERCARILQATNQALVEHGERAKEFKKISVIQTTTAELVVADSRMTQAVLVGTVLAVMVMLAGMLLYEILDDRILVASDLRQVTRLPFAGYAGAEGIFGQDYEYNLDCLREKTGQIYVLEVAQMSTKEQELKAADGIVLVVDYGRTHAAWLDYVIEQLKVRECRVAGIAIGGADVKFLRRYYGRAFGSLQKQKV